LAISNQLRMNSKLLEEQIWKGSDFHF
jgi:hypothetical protein